MNKKVRVGAVQMQIIKDLCKQEKIHIIINGYFDIEGKIYNRSYLIDDGGVILGHYDKIYLWKNELEIERGKEVKVIKTRFGKVGLSICWDMYFPDHIKQMKILGAEMVFNSSYWNNKSKKEACAIDCTPTSLSYLYLVFYIFVNCKLKENTSVSQICAPYGKLSEIRYEEGLIFADLYPARIDIQKEYFKPVFWDREELL